MGANSKISWTDHTFNPVWGCTKVGPGCDHCYAEAFDRRVGGDHWGPGKPRREFGDKHWNEPLKWNAVAEKLQMRLKVFCASMADVFDNEWPEQTRLRLWALIRATPFLDWIIVTKRIGNAPHMLPWAWEDNPYPNVWLLITVVNQAEADRDIAKLLNIPAAVHGLSVEPQLEQITLSKVSNGYGHYDALAKWPIGKTTLDWVITGAESGHGARPYSLDWARSLRDECQEAGAAFFLKQIVVHGKKIETPDLDGRRWAEFPV